MKINQVFLDTLFKKLVFFVANVKRSHYFDSLFTIINKCVTLIYNISVMQIEIFINLLKYSKFNTEQGRSPISVKFFDFRNPAIFWLGFE